MSFEEALLIFRLDKGYTEEKLKKRYRELLKKYHPDAVVNSDEKIKEKAAEKIRGINVAYEVLFKQLSKSFSQNNSYTSFDIDSYRRKKVSELEEKMKFDFDRYEK